MKNWIRYFLFLYWYAVGGLKSWGRSVFGQFQGCKSVQAAASHISKTAHIPICEHDHDFMQEWKERTENMIVKEKIEMAKHGLSLDEVRECSDEIKSS